MWKSAKERDIIAEVYGFPFPPYARNPRQEIHSRYDLHTPAADQMFCEFADDRRRAHFGSLGRVEGKSTVQLSRRHRRWRLASGRRGV